MFCSIIIPTIGRSTLERAVMSVLEQEFSQDEFQVVVVNDSTKSLAPADWQKSDLVQVIDTQKRERSHARNAGAAVAKGDYLVFLDDDDWWLPGALAEFWRLASENKDAVWLYGGIRIVDEDGACLAEINSGLSGNCFAQIMGGAWAPLQASMIKADRFFAVGGFNPFICGTEDEDLCRRIAYQGDFANTKNTVACLFRGRAWKTSTNYLRAPEDTKVSRDLVLQEANSFTRLLASANDSYWSGRICRVYMSVFVWNFRQRRFFSASSRFMYFFAAFILSCYRIPSASFWRGFRTHHAVDTLHYVIEAYEGGKKDNFKDQVFEEGG
jgi:glycosyltransferase involved in cell wall biosynthesis